MSDFLQRLKQRKLVQWAVAYVAFAFALIQVADVVAGSYHWSDGVMHLLFGLLVLGFVVALLLAWYHGEQGRQRASGTELLLIALVLAVGGGLLWRFAQVGPGHTDIVILKPPAGHAASATVLASGSTAQAAAIAAIPAKSIAVLPFVNMSGDPKNDYFSDGVTEEILDALAQVPKLKVAARTSAFAFKGKAEDLRKVGDVLDVATVLEGSVQKSGDEVRITAQLIDTRTGYHLWSEKYDRKLTSIFAVEDEISKAIADKLEVQLAESGKQSLVPQRTIDPRAHDAYLRGLTLLAARGSGLQDAVTAFQNAVKIDPDYAQAWGALAETEMLLPGYEPDVTAAVAYARAKTAAERALAIDPNNAEAYVALSVVYGTHWEQRDHAIQRALQLAPGDAEAVYQHAYFLLLTGNLEAALHEMDHALRISPLSPIIAAERVETLIYLHRYVEALKQADATIDAHPDFPLTYGYAALAEVQLHHYTEAAAYVKRAATLGDFEVDFGVDAASLLQLIHGLSDPAQRAEALRVAAHLESGGQNQAEWLCALGANAQALTAVERGLRSKGDPGLEIEVIWSPMLDPIRDDPRFKAVLKKLRLPYLPSPTDAAP